MRPYTRKNPRRALRKARGSTLLRSLLLEPGPRTFLTAFWLRRAPTHDSRPGHFHCGACKKQLHAKAGGLLNHRCPQRVRGRQHTCSAPRRRRRRRRARRRHARLHRTGRSRQCSSTA